MCRLLLRCVDKENVALALAGVIKRNSFSVGRAFGSYGTASLMQSVMQTATQSFTAGHMMP
jgi:hypothetical protein